MTQWHQPVVVQRVAFHHVDDVELVFGTRHRVFYSKEKPLRVAVGVDVSLEHEVISGGKCEQDVTASLAAASPHT